MGGKRHGKKPFVDRNSPNTISFKLLPSADAEYGPDGERDSGRHPTVLKRFIPPNAAKKNKFAPKLAAELLRVLRPEDFGLTDSRLSVQQLRDLCEEIYGSIDEADFNALREHLQNDLKKHKPKAPVPVDDLENRDCYLPADGYNYEQHLRTLSDPASGNSGDPFSSLSRSTAAPLRLPVVEKAAPPVPRSQEEAAVLAALEQADEYDELSDDFVAEAGGADEAEVEALLWGQREALPPVPRSQRLEDGLDDIEELRVKLEDQHLDSNSSDLEDSQSDDSQSEGAEGGDDESRLRRLLEEEYAESEIGELDEGAVTAGDGAHDNELQHSMAQFASLNTRKKLMPLSELEEALHAASDEISREELKAKTLAIADTLQGSTDHKNLDEDPFFAVKPRTKWDCETVLSTRTNTCNRPASIVTYLHSSPAATIQRTSSQRKGGPPPLDLSTVDAILRARSIKKVVQAVGVPEAWAKKEEGATAAGKATTSSIPTDSEGEEQQEGATDSAPIDLAFSTLRPRNETPEERRARKEAARRAKQYTREQKRAYAAIAKKEALQKKRLAHNPNNHVRVISQ